MRSGKREDSFGAPLFYMQDKAKNRLWQRVLAEKAMLKLRQGGGMTRVSSTPLK